MNHDSFSHLLENLISKNGVTLAWLAKETNLARGTIKNWLNGSSKQARNWEDVVSIAQALRLSVSQTNQLLLASSHPSLEELLVITKYDSTLFYWFSELASGDAPKPFQALPDIPYFVGREELIKELKSVLVQHYHRTLYFLTGMAGVGKTTLATRLAYQLRSYFPDGVLWVHVASDDKLSLLGNLAAAFNINGIWHSTTLDSRSQKVREILAKKKSLLILDDVNGREEIELFLPPNGPCATLITTRRRDLPASFGGKEFLVPPFPPESEASLELFTQFVGSKQVIEKADSFKKLADTLGHHPLAIAIMGGKLILEGDETIDTLIVQTQYENFRLKDLEFADRSVQASLKTTLKSLDEDTKELFLNLNVFGKNSFDKNSVTYVLNWPTNKTEQILQLLLSVSMLQQESNHRYRIHELILVFIQESTSTPNVFLQERLIEYFVTFAEENTESLEALDLEGSNIQNAIRLAQELGKWEMFLRGILAFQRYFLTKGLFKLAERYYRKGVELNISENNDLRQVKLYACLGSVLYHSQSYESASQLFRKGLEIARSTNNEDLISLLLSNTSAALAKQGNSGLSIQYLHESLQLAKKSNNPRRILIALNNLAEREKTIGNYIAAKEHYLSALSFAHTSKDYQLLSTLLANLSALEIEQKKYTEAERVLKEALKIALKTDHKKDLSVIYTNLGSIYLSRGQHDKSKDYIEKGLAIAVDLNLPWLIGEIYLERGELGLITRDWETANSDFLSALNIAIGINSMESEALALFGLAKIRFHLQNFTGAKSYLHQSLEKMQFLNHPKVNEVSDWINKIFLEERKNAR